jgi:hypothetical protein
VKKVYFLFLKVLFLLILASTFVFGQKPGKGKTKFYNFDELLINGEYRRPQVLFTDARQKVKFERLLKLKKDFLPKLESTKKDPSLR